MERILASLPELPREKQERFVRDYALPEYDAGVLTDSRPLADYFEACVAEYSDAKAVSNWIMGDFLRLLREENLEIEEVKMAPANLARMLQLMDKGVISSKIAKTVFEEMFKTGKDPEKIVEEKGLVQISDASQLEEIVLKVIEANPSAVEDVKNGKDRAIGFLVGQVMKETRGKANPGMVNQILKDKINSL